MATRPLERDDLDALLNPLVGFAQDQLRKHGEFFPFANFMRSDGGIEFVAGYTGSERPPSQEVIDLLVAGMRSKADAGEIRAVGLCFDARLRTDDGKATDVIVVSLEHRVGDTVQVSMPYAKARFSGLRFGDLTSGPGERRVFRDSQPSATM